MQTTTTSADLRPLGQTDIRVSAIGLGVMEFSGGGPLLGRAFPVIPQDTKNAIVQAALDGGINWFDTAEMYGMGESERSLAAALHSAGKSDDDVVVATKWMPFPRTAANIPKTIDNRLRALDGYSIDLYMVHQPWSFSPPEAEMNAMADLAEAGKIRAVGVSNFSPQQMRRASRALRQRGLVLASNQVKYSLLDRKIERDGTLETARELGVTIIAYTPLESGLLTGKYHKAADPQSGALVWRKWMIRRNLERTRSLVEAMETIGQRYDATVAQVALNWLINYSGDTVVTIPGATKVHQAQQNAGAMAFRLTDDEMSQLDELSQLA